MLGVPAATIRNWEQRYATIVPERSPGGHRLYSRDQVEQLRFIATDVVQTGFFRADLDTMDRVVPNYFALTRLAEIEPEHPRRRTASGATVEDGRPRIIPNRAGARLTPSLVGFTPEGERLVGEAASALAEVHPERVAFLALDAKGNPGAACTARTNFQYAVGRTGKAEMVKAPEIGAEEK